jgi:hypothetical protein
MRLETKKYLITGLFLCGISGCNSSPPDKKSSGQFVGTAVSVDGKIFCGEHKDWFITMISGPCDTFTGPAKVAIGEKFTANGKIRTVKFILATQADEDMIGDGLNIKKGQWSCMVAESTNDLDLEGDGNKLWLYIADCQPGQTLSTGSYLRVPNFQQG